MPCNNKHLSLYLGLAAHSFSLSFPEKKKKKTKNQTQIKPQTYSDSSFLSVKPSSPLALEFDIQQLCVSDLLLFLYGFRFFIFFKTVFSKLSHRQPGFSKTLDQHSDIYIDSCSFFFFSSSPSLFFFFFHYSLTASSVLGLIFY